MAVGVLVMLPGVKKEQYTQVNEKMWGKATMDSSQAPDGLIIHTAGPTQDGWYVSDVWESKGDFARFGHEKVQPACRHS